MRTKSFFVLGLLDFKKALEEQINTSCSVLEESIVQTYEKHSKTIQDKLQELFAVLERISMLFILTHLIYDNLNTDC